LSGNAGSFEIEWYSGRFVGDSDFESIFNNALVFVVSADPEPKKSVGHLNSQVAIGAGDAG
jgi:hypothetical protein